MNEPGKPSMDDVEITTDQLDESAMEGSAPSFDDIEELTETKADKEAIKEVISDEPAEGKENQVVEEEVAAESPEEGDIDEITEEEIKRITASYGEETLEIPETAVFIQKVDGEEQEVTLAELRQNFAGKVPWDRRFQELDKKTKDFEREKNQINQYVNDFAKKVNDGDVLGAMEYVAEFAGKDPLEFRKEIKTLLLTNLQEYASLSEEQRKQADLQEENEFLRRRQQSESERRAQDQEQASVQRELDRIQETYGIDDTALVALHDDLVANGVAKETITTAMLEKYHRSSVAYGKAEKVLGEFDESYVNNDAMVETVKRYVDSDLMMDENAVREYVTKSFPGISQKKSASKSVSNRVRKSASKSSVSKADSAQKKSEVDNLFSFDDL